jgi:serine/threonine protein phosphatase PrpC
MKVENDYMSHKPIVSYFGVFDGHGGESVAEVLNENLHNYIIDENIFNNPVNSILNGFSRMEKYIMNRLGNTTEQTDSSGSCALISILLGKCFL